MPLVWVCEWCDKTGKSKEKVDSVELKLRARWERKEIKVEYCPQCLTKTWWALLEDTPDA